jgi:N-acetyl-anhydromuramyl-L-alanine amidase AmpD
MIVIHKAEGSLDSTVSWFANPASQVSAHYTVDDNTIAQSLPDSAVAWHTGNHTYNEISIGIENSGYTARDDFTEAHYRRLAQLVAYLCAKHGIPMDRSHIIGHNEVPDPNHPGRFGGAGNHQDPGHYFDWSKFMSYVQSASQGQ